MHVFMNECPQLTSSRRLRRRTHHSGSADTPLDGTQADFTVRFSFKLRFSCD